MSHARGLDLQNALAAYLRTKGFPHAESAGAGRNGTDVNGTPGICWENKTAYEFKPLEFVRQAQANAAGTDVPVVVYWPRKIGERSADHALFIVPLRWGVTLLRASGYAD